MPNLRPIPTAISTELKQPSPVNRLTNTIMGRRRASTKRIIIDTAAKHKRRTQPLAVPSAAPALASLRRVRVGAAKRLPANGPHFGCWPGPHVIRPPHRSCRASISAAVAVIFPVRHGSSLTESFSLTIPSGAALGTYTFFAPATNQSAISVGSCSASTTLVTNDGD